VLKIPFRVFSSTRLRRLPTNKRGFETTTPLPELWPAAPQQSSRDEHRRDGVWAGRRTQSAVGALPVSAERSQDLPAHGDMAARADESGAALLGEQMGLADSLREGGRFIEGSAAGQ
jgi:hypothetical protein